MVRWLTPDPGFEEEPVRSPQRSIVTTAFLLLLAGAGFGQVTQRVSVNSDGISGNHRSIRPSISGDGRYAAFVSEASNLVPGDDNHHWDVFVRDRVAGTTERISVNAAGVEGLCPGGRCDWARFILVGPPGDRGLGSTLGAESPSASIAAPPQLARFHPPVSSLSVLNLTEPTAGGRYTLCLPVSASAIL
jgi:hypothetical protein